MEQSKKKHFIEVSFLTTVTIIFLAINLLSLKNWYFSAIGDEYAYFNYAKSIAAGQYLPNVFSQKGVYDVIPTLSSYHQAMIMRILGINVFGWKASHVLLISTTIPALYFLCKKILNKQVAVLSTIFYASNHLLWAYVHTGYSNIEALFPYILSLIAFAYRKFFLSGIFAALGFYTFYTSRLTFIVILALFFIVRSSIKFKTAFIKFLIGFAILIIPFLITNNTTIIKSMLERSIVSQNEAAIYKPIYKFILVNVVRNAIAPWYNLHLGPYSSGSLVDPLTGIFLIVGFLLIIKRLEKNSQQILALFVIPLLIVAVSSPYGDVVVSRLHILLPAYAIISGFGCVGILKLIPLSKLRNILIIIIIMLVLYLNSYRFFIETPLKIMPTNEALTIKVLTTTCRNSLSPAVLGNVNPLLVPALNAYQLNPKLINDLNMDIIYSFKNTDCLILEYPQTQKINYYFKEAKKNHYTSEIIYDNAKKLRIVVFRR